MMIFISLNILAGIQFKMKLFTMMMKLKMLRVTKLLFLQIILYLFQLYDPLFLQYLHSYSLSFKDPKTNKLKTYTADYPKEYSLLLNELDKENND